MSADEASCPAAAASVDKGSASAMMIGALTALGELPPEDALRTAAKSFDILANIKALKMQQNTLRDEKKVISKLLRNEEKRRVRLRNRARQLSDSDLLTVLKMRVVVPDEEVVPKALDIPLET